jgi:hypothetical protein
MDYSKSSNGRINLYSKQKTTYDEPDISKLFSMYDKIPANQSTTLREPSLSQFDETPLSHAYFSDENIRIIQNGIRAGVYKKSNGQYTIGHQDYDAVKIIMRSIFLQHSVNRNTNVTQQIEELNAMVLNYCISSVYLEAQGYLKYLYDASTLADPIAHPVFASENDKRNHKLPNWF